MVGGGEDRGGDGTDRLFGAASGAQATKLCLQIAAVFAGGRPGALDQGGLEPGGALAHPVGPALARTLVVSGAETGPGDQMSDAREAAHIAADLGADDIGAQIADPGNGGQQQ